MKVEKNGAIQLSAIDIGIIEQLRVDGRMTTRELAKNLQISEVTARKRLKRLQESSILKVVAVVNPAQLSFNIHAVISLRVDIRKLEAVGKALAQYPEVRFLAITSGGYDIHFTAALKDSDHLLTFLTKKVAPLDGIVSTNTVVSLRVLKSAYKWLSFDDGEELE